MQMNRRFFLHKGALAIAGTAAIPSFLIRSVMAETSSKRRLVVVFQRGAADGTSGTVPRRVVVEPVSQHRAPAARSAGVSRCVCNDLRRPSSGRPRSSAAPGG